MNWVTGIMVCDGCNAQAYKENQRLDLSVHPSITRYLYEDRHAVVS